MASVSYEHVYKRYPGNTVISDMNAEIKDKEFVVLVGPSGSGKSTALRMLAGLEEISDGMVKIGERVVNEVAPKDRDIAMVFQSYALYPHMTVYDNLSFGLKLRKTPKSEIDKRVRDAAGILGLEQLLERKPKALSGGQRQRVALGRAIVRQPKVFLMDEPLSNLDAKLRVQTRVQILKLHQRLQTTFIYVTHDQVEAVEKMGSENFVYFTIGGKTFTPRMDPRSSDIQPGQNIQVAVDTGHIHLFDPKTEKALVSRGTPAAAVPAVAEAPAPPAR